MKLDSWELLVIVLLIDLGIALAIMYGDLLEFFKKIVEVTFYSLFTGFVIAKIVRKAS